MAVVAKTCPQCGATVEVDADALSATCAFCDSPLVDAPPDGDGAVDKVVPFLVPRDRAGRLLKGFLSGHWLAPEALRRAARPEELASVLVPFYAWDATARTQYSCRVGIHWYRTETYTVTENGKTETRTREVQETEWFPLEGTHGKTWLDHLTSASKGLPEAEANELEPFDLGKALPFAPALTAGLVAERPTVRKEEALLVARQELANREQRAVATTLLPGDRYSDLKSSSVIDVHEVKLVLLPVWIAVFRGPKGPVRLLVNGQTGEVVGKIPRSGAKIGCLVGVVILLIAGIVSLVLFGGALLAAVGSQ